MAGGHHPGVDVGTDVTEVDGGVVHPRSSLGATDHPAGRNDDLALVGNNGHLTGTQPHHAPGCEPGSTRPHGWGEPATVSMTAQTHSAASGCTHAQQGTEHTTKTLRAEQRLQAHLDQG